MGVCRWNTAEEVMNILRAGGRELVKMAPNELTVDNMVRRVLFLVREEYSGQLRDMENEEEEEEEENSSEVLPILPPSPLTRVDSVSRADGVDPHNKPSLDNFLTSKTLSSDFSISVPDLRHHLLDAVSSLLDEIETVHLPICEQSLDHIHANEVILTHGFSNLLSKFLRSVGEKRSFSVIVTEGEPHLSGRKLCQELADLENINITLIPDSNAFALMSRVNKVILSCHTVLADGAVVGRAGSKAILQGAKARNIPVLCLAGMFKISPLYPHTLSSLFSQLAPPFLISGMEEVTEEAQIIVSLFDHIPPELVDLYITDQGGHQPSYVYRLLSEVYHSDDQDYQHEEK